MKSTKTFNNISDKLKASIPQLKPGQRVKFKMLTGMPNPEPDPRERAKQGEMLYGKIQLLTNFRIYDPYQKDGDGNEVGGYVDVGCVDQWLGDNPSKFRLFIPGITGVVLHNRAFQGEFELSGDSVADRELFEVLWLSPERKESPSPDSSYEIKFKIVDERAGIKGTVNKFDNLKKVLAILDTIQPEEAEGILSALNLPTYQDKELQNVKLKEYALSNVDQFLNTYESKATPFTAIIKKAMNAKVVGYDFRTGEVTVGGATIATIKVSSIDKFPAAFTQWINSSENGKDVFENIKNQLNRKEEVA